MAIKLVTRMLVDGQEVRQASTKEFPGVVEAYQDILQRAQFATILAGGQPSEGTITVTLDMAKEQPGLDRAPRASAEAERKAGTVNG